MISTCPRLVMEKIRRVLNSVDDEGEDVEEEVDVADCY